MKYTTAILTLLLYNFSHSAVIESYPIADDENFKAWNYVDNGKYLLQAYLFHTTKVDFDKSETVNNTNILNVNCLDAWFVKKSQNSIFVTPLKGDCDTILRVQTSQSQYFFDLKSNPPIGNYQEKAVLAYTFFYPPSSSAGGGAEGNIDIIEFKRTTKVNCFPKDKQPYNYNYSMSDREGDVQSREIAPDLIFDDGKFTYIHFPRSIPAIFSVDDAGYEFSTTTATDGNGCVRIDGTSRAMSLKYGSATVCLFNEVFSIKEKLKAKIRRR